MIFEQVGSEGCLSYGVGCEHMFTATRDLARALEVPVVMHRGSTAPFVDLRVDDGER